MVLFLVGRDGLLEKKVWQGYKPYILEKLKPYPLPSLFLSGLGLETPASLTGLVFWPELAKTNLRFDAGILTCGTIGSEPLNGQRPEFEMAGRTVQLRWMTIVRSLKANSETVPSEPRR